MDARRSPRTARVGGWGIRYVFWAAVATLPARLPAQEADAETAGATAPDDAAEAEAKRLEGHSVHGESFNEGPRQQAKLLGGTGAVSFPVTIPASTSDVEGADAAAIQAFFDQGVGQLHGFWYYEAERSFRQVAAMVPSCRMAYWGMAMANFENEARARGFIQKAVEIEGEITEKEQAWIDGLAAFLREGGDRKDKRRDYVRSLERLVLAHPDDIEPKAFLVVRLWQFKGDLPMTSHVAVDALIRDVLEVSPMHPVHHYKIHVWDHEKPDEALGSAALCGQSAPRIAHMWHMSGHIFSDLKRYEDAVWQQEASARVDHANMARDRVLPDQIHNYAHNNEWLIRNLNHIGRVKDAIDLAKNMLELPRHPKYNTLDRGGRSASYGRERLFQTLERYEMWDQLVELSETVWLEPSDIAGQAIHRLRALGRARFEQGRGAELDELHARLESWKARIEIVREAAEAVAVQKAREESKSDEDVEKARKAAEREATRERGGVESAITELAYYRRVLGGDDSAALLGELDGVPGLSEERRVRIAVRLGDREKAVEAARKFAAEREGEVVPLATLVWALAQAEKSDELPEPMGRLRDLAGGADLDVPVFQRLAPIAATLGLPEDWRLQSGPKDDVGTRPELDSLGTLRWQPWVAPKWSLPAARGGELSLAGFQGRPVIVVFYLGYGCLHCVEQLRVFAPQQAAFRRQGVDMVAISMEEVAKVRESLIEFDRDGPFLIPLLADPKMEVFKAYGAFDDFEGEPLHGTFLIDGQRRVLWQDISYEPFTEIEFLLGETARLLGRVRERRLEL